MPRITPLTSAHREEILTGQASHPSLGSRTTFKFNVLFQTQQSWYPYLVPAVTAAVQLEDLQSDGHGVNIPVFSCVIAMLST